MADLGIVIVIVGFGLASIGQIWMIIEAMRKSYILVIALLIVPCFAFALLLMDFRKFWKPLLANVAGGGIMQLGMLVWVMDVQADMAAQGVSVAPVVPIRPEPGVPYVPGVYIPNQEQPAQGFLETVDPMLFALLGGLFVFAVVGIAAGGFLIGTMDTSVPDDEDEDDDWDE